MFRGVYQAASGMLAAQRYQEILTNNLTNAQTPGYKQDQTVLHSFPEILMYRIKAQASRSSTGATGGIQRSAAYSPVGTLHTGVFAQEAVPNFRQGPLTETGRSLDVAIVDQTLPPNPDTGREGTLFFAVQAPSGEIRYLRNGQFALDEEGYLTTADGYYVLDENLNPLYVGNDQFTVTTDGYILLDEQALPEAPPGVLPQVRIWLGYTEEPEHLIREGHGLWRWAPDGPVEGPYGEPVLAYGLPVLDDPANPGSVPFQLRQGFIEQSNVDVGQTMANMIIQLRLYEANQRVLQAYDRSMELAANQIGRLY